MRITLGNSSGKTYKGNNSADVGGPVDNNAAQVVSTGINRVHLNRSSSPNLSNANYLTPHSAGLTPSRISKTCYPKNTYRKRKTSISPARLFDPFDLDVVFHQNKQSKLSLNSNMVSSNAKPKPRTDFCDPLVEAVTDSAAASESTVFGPTMISQGSSRVNPRAEEIPQQVQISRSSLSVGDANESPTEYDPNNPAMDDYCDGEDEITYTQTSTWNHSNAKTELPPSFQSNNLNPHCLSISSVLARRNSSKESPYIAGKSRDKDFKSLIKKQLKFDVAEMDGDGNCLFRAVALQVYGDASMHSEVRRRCVEFMVS
jgi:hypothetical protein